MTLSTRNLMILEYLSRVKTSSIKDIAEIFKISESSARYDLKNINFLLETKKSGEIKFFSKGIIECILKDDEVINLENDKWQYVFTSEERIEFLEIYILLESYPFNMQKIMDKLEITRNTLKSDLEKVKLNFEKLGITMDTNGALHIQRGSRRTYLLIPFSRIIRRLIFQDKIYYFINNFIFENALKHVNLKNLHIIKKYVKEILKENGKILSDESYQMLIAYIIILVETIANGFNVCEENRNEIFFKTKKEYKILESKKYILEEGFNIKISGEELLRLTNYFLGSQTYTRKIEFYENWIRSEIFIEKFIRKVSEKIGLDLNHDSILFKGLLNHLKPAIYRIKNNIHLENSIYEELIEKEKYLFDIVKNSLSEIKELNDISNDEISYLVVYFKAAIDRIEIKRNKKKNVLIICNFGYGTSKLLAQNLKENYDISIKKIIPFYELEKYERLNEIDCIITTTEFKNIKHDIPIIKVNPILEKEDYLVLDSLNFCRNKNKISLKELIFTIKDEIKEDKLESIIYKLKNKFGEFLVDDFIEEKQPTLLELLPLERIKIIDEEKNWKSAIRIIGDVLVEDKSIERSYVEDTIKVVEDNGTYMIINNRYGVFHAKNNNNVNKSSLGMLVLKKPLQVKDKTINIILLLSSKDGHEHLNGIVEFSRVFENEKNIKEVINLDSSEEVYSFISVKSRSI
ncbi:PRD domain-containing protein [Fusobacterium sp.]|uniref:BglG family transcription antiterminator n=1 Tax=Fusobacterium sp. TaxID=68766 RepID=UPI00262390B4|nr:PRD domain-containing protein [Fusobacterium sp.]